MRQKTPDILGNVMRERRYQNDSQNDSHHDNKSQSKHSDETPSNNVDKSQSHNVDMSTNHYDDLDLSNNINIPISNNSAISPRSQDIISPNSNEDMTSNHNVTKSTSRKIKKERSTFYFSKKLLKDLDKCWVKVRDMRGDRKISRSDIVETALEVFVHGLLKEKEDSQLFIRLKGKKEIED